MKSFFGYDLLMVIFCQAHVIKVKNTDSLPFTMIVANFIVSAEWLFYGIIIDDAYVEVCSK
jgi:uncharacterized protein with PQ loop repeat